MKTNIINKIQTGVAVMAAALICTACSDTWDDHYGVAETGEKGSLWTAIKTDANLSNFAKVVEALGYDKVLGSDQILTVFAPVNDHFSAAQADSVINIYNTQKENHVKDQDNMAIKQFLKNHIALYNNSVSATSQDSISMLNGKYIALNNNRFGNSNLLTKNELHSNGILFKIDNKLDYAYNVFEYLKEDNDLKKLADFLYSYNVYEFNENKSVPGGVRDGKTWYLDSVEYLNNIVLNNYGLLNHEDSTYWQAVPTDKEWDRMFNEYVNYFNYSPKIDKKERDSLVLNNTQLAIYQGTTFSMTLQKDKWKDSLRSTSYHRNIVPSENLYTLGYHYKYLNPFEEGGVFANAKQIDCSNGKVLKVDDWKINAIPYFQYRKIEAENLSNQDTISAVSGDGNIRTVPVSSPYYNKVYNNRFFEMQGETNASRPTVRFKVPNILSNISYDVYVVILPATAYNQDATDELPNCVQLRMYYVDEKGNSKNQQMPNPNPTDGKFYFITDPKEITYLPMAIDYKFPTCSYALDGADVKVEVIGRTLNTKTLREKYSGTIRIDAVLFVPHGVDPRDNANNI